MGGRPWSVGALWRSLRCSSGTSASWPANRFWNILRRQILEAQVSGPLVTDAALAALAIEQGATLCSTDRDFRRFQGLKLFDPVQPAR
jgi:predicted nucleic acid-binding protein